MADDNGNASGNGASPETTTTGQGESSLHIDPHHTREDLRLTEVAIRKGWVAQDEPWDIEITLPQIEELIRGGKDLSLKDRTLLSCHIAMATGTKPNANDADLRVMVRGAAIVKELVGQNLAVALKKYPDLVAHIHQMADGDKREQLRQLIESVGTKG